MWNSKGKKWEIQITYSNIAYIFKVVLFVLRINCHRTLKRRMGEEFQQLLPIRSADGKVKGNWEGFL